MAQDSVRYGLRARQTFTKRSLGAQLSSQEATQPYASATIGAGLRVGVLSKAELLRFRARSTEYLEAR